MTLSPTHHSLLRTAWQARIVAYASGATAGAMGLGFRGCGLERTEVPGSLVNQVRGTRLQGCIAKRPEDPGGWQEQKLL